MIRYRQSQRDKVKDSYQQKHKFFLNAPPFAANFSEDREENLLRLRTLKS